MVHKTTIFLIFSLIFVNLGQDSSSDSDSESQSWSSSGSAEDRPRHHHHHHRRGNQNPLPNPPPIDIPPPPPVIPLPPSPPPSVPKNHGCGGWKYFKRPSGGWCMQVFAGQLTQPQAASKCTAQKAKLSGIQNANERKWIVRTTMKRISAASGAVWIGAKRRAACVGKHKTAACPWYNSFEWTDGSATGRAGFKWNHTQPDNAWKDQNCAQLIASNAKFIRARQVYITGHMDDISCTSKYTASNAARKPRAYICGKKAPY